MRVAIVRNSDNKVLNIVEVGGLNNPPPPPGSSYVDDSTKTALMGGTWTGGTNYTPRQVDPQQTNSSTLLDNLQNALDNVNPAFLAIGAPSNAQMIAQVKALTRQVNALIRQEMKQFDSLAGT